MLKIIRKSRALSGTLISAALFLAGVVLSGEAGSIGFGELSLCGALEVSGAGLVFGGAAFRALITGSVGRRIVKLAAMAVIVIAKLVSDNSSRPKNCGIITGAAITASGAAVSWLIGELPQKMLFYVIYAAAAGAASYAGSTILSGWKKKKCIDLSGSSGICCAVSYMVLISSAATLKIAVFHPAVIVSALVSLIAAYFYGCGEAVICAAVGCSGIAAAAGGSGLTAAVMTISCLSAANFGKKTHLASAAAYIIPAFLITAFSGRSAVYGLMPDIVCACGIFAAAAPAYSMRYVITASAETERQHDISAARGMLLADTVSSAISELERVNAFYLSADSNKPRKKSAVVRRRKEPLGFYENMRLAEELIRRDIKSESVIYSPVLGRKIGERLTAAGMEPKKVTASYNRAHRLTVAVVFDRKKAPKITDRLYGMIADEADTELIPSSTVKTAEEILIGMYEEPTCELETMAAVSCADGSDISGDSSAEFTDLQGKHYIVISDGMGTGKNAAVESKMIISFFRRLICSGMEPENAVRMVNAIMVNKLGEETFGTLDVMIFDPDSCRAVFIKSGAAATVIRHDDDVTKIAAATFPIGINSRAEMFRCEQELSPGDAVIMFSDGISDSALPYVRELLLKGITIEETVGCIAKKAGVFSQGGRRDDVTVIGIEVRSADEN